MESWYAAFDAKAEGLHLVTRHPPAELSPAPGWPSRLAVFSLVLVALVLAYRFWELVVPGLALIALTVGVWRLVVNAADPSLRGVYRPPPSKAHPDVVYRRFVWNWRANRRLDAHDYGLKAFRFKNRKRGS